MQKTKSSPNYKDANQRLGERNTEDQQESEDDYDEEDAVTPQNPTAASTNTFEFQGKTYTRYQDFVDAKKAFNEKVLNSVGVVEAAQKLKNKKSRPVTPESERNKKRRSNNSGKTPRKSPRLEKQKSAADGNETKEVDDTTPEEIDDSESEEEESLVTLRRRVAYGASRPVERVNLSEDDDEPWVADMQEWLEPLVSLPNCRNVIRQVRLLASGVGVDYRYWSKGVSFYKGTKIDLTFDLDALLDEAYEFENKHGKDRGNGWLLLHPIKKMSLFKKYLDDKS